MAGQHGEAQIVAEELVTPGPVDHRAPAPGDLLGGVVLQEELGGADFFGAQFREWHPGHCECVGEWC